MQYLHILDVNPLSDVRLVNIFSYSRNCRFILLIVFFAVFWYEGYIGLMKWVWKYSLLIIVLEEFKKNWFSFFKSLTAFTCETIRSLTFLHWETLITISISLLIICMFRFSVSWRFSLGRLYVSRNVSIFLLFNFLVYTCS